MDQKELEKIIERCFQKKERQLDLSYKELNALPRTIGELTRLTVLDLRGNQLNVLPIEMGNLTNLTTLYLNHNQLSDLPAELGNLTNLTEIYLRGNQLSALPAEIGNLTNLTKLYLRYNQLSDLPPSIGEFTNLTILDLRDNKLTILPASVGELANLTEFYLSGNQLSRLPVTMRQLTNLTEFEIRDNQLSDLPAEMGNLTNLTNLNLSYNKLSILSKAMGEFTNLTILDLSGNQLSVLPADLGELIQLTTLDLSDNQLSALPVTIGELTNLTQLYLDQNELSALPESMGELINLTKLYLQHNQLSALPESMGELTNLKQLYLQHNQLSALPGSMGKLTNLTELYLRDNELSDLPVTIGELTNLTKFYLGSNQLSALPAGIGQLTNLTELYLDHNQLSALPTTIGELTNLKQLYLGDNKLSALPETIGKLINLTRLYLNGNQLSALPATIGELTNLARLYLNDNQLSALPAELGESTHLTRLNFNNNQLSALPISIGKLVNLTTLNLRDNPLISPPLEIATQGIGPIRSYLTSLEEESQLLNEVKVLMVGEGSAGKTSLTKSILGEDFDPRESPTHKIRIKNWPVQADGRKIKVNIWDFGGQEIMHATHRFFLSKRSLYVLILDGRRDERPEYWLHHIESFGGDSPILIVLNKCDANPGFDINRPFLQQKYPAICGFYHTSCATGQGIDEFKRSLVQELSQVEMLTIRLANSWFQVKQQLEGLNEDYISYDCYEKICVQAQITEPISQDVLVEYLDALSVIVHFKDFVLQDTHILEPKWVTEAVYRIINSEKIAAEKGTLRLQDLIEILKPHDQDDYVYPRYKHKYIIALMEKFELCYSLDTERILIPQLLDVVQPFFDFDYTDSVNFRLDYANFLPLSIMPQFIVKRHRDIKDGLHWRTGVVLESRFFQSTAVVWEDNEDNRIHIAVNGYQRKDYLAVILLDFRELNDGFEKLKVSEQVPMPDNPNVIASYKTLINLNQLGIDTFVTDNIEKVYSVRELLGLVQLDERGQGQELLDIVQSKEKILDQKSFIENINRIIDLKPNVFGIGINLNELLYRSYQAWQRSKGEDY